MQKNQQATVVFQFRRASVWRKSTHVDRSFSYSKLCEPKRIMKIVATAMTRNAKQCILLHVSIKSVHLGNNSGKKSRKTEKTTMPVSRILCSRLSRNDRHLSGTVLAHCLTLPTHMHRASHPQAHAYLTFQHTRFTRKPCYHDKP